jgi:hypothetical protein
LVGAVVSLLLVLTSLGTAAGSTAGGAAGTVYVQTVPALAGVQLNVGGASVTTRTDGSARVEVSSINQVQHHVALTSTRVDDRTSVALSRVSPEPHTAPHVSRLSLALTVTSRVRLVIDPGSSGLSAGDVTGVRLHSLAGQVLEVHPGEGGMVTLVSRRAMLQRGVLTAQKVTWSVDRVTTRDGSTVTTDSPRFDPFTSSVWTIQLSPVAGTVVVDTIPRTPGVMVTVAGTTLTTGAHGRGTASVSDLNAVSDHVHLVTPEADGSEVEVLHVTKRPPPAIRHRRLLIALRVSDPVTFEFVDPNGHPLSSARVDEVDLNQGGRTRTISRQELAGPVMLPSSIARQVHGIWQVRRLNYSIQAVSVNGANAVFSGRQRFEPGGKTTWRVNLSVYDLAMTVRDSLLGRRVGSVVQVTFPDGKQRRLYVGDGQPTVLSSLVRGMYQLDVGAAVIGSEQTVLVSRDSSGDFRVITRLDLVLCAVVGLALVGGLVLTGRRLAVRTPRPSRGEAR